MILQKKKKEVTERSDAYVSILILPGSYDNGLCRGRNVKSLAQTVDITLLLSVRAAIVTPALLSLLLIWRLVAPACNFFLLIVITLA